MSFLTDQYIRTVVIAGAGGFGLEVYDYLLHVESQGGPKLAGFIDDTPGIAPGFGVERPVLGTINDYVQKEAEVVVVAIGSVSGRRLVLEKLWGKGVSTPAFIAEQTLVSPAATIDRGVIVCPFSIIGRGARLGTGSVVNVHGSVGHGASVGDFSVLSPFAALNGDSSVGQRCFLGTRSTIYPKTHIGDDCVVDTHCGVRQSVPQGRVMITNRGNYQVIPRRV